MSGKCQGILVSPNCMNPVDGESEMCRMANSVYPDQTASLEAVWSGSTLFLQAYLSGYLW